MQQALVVYTSKTGFTQRFALSIAQALHCELIEMQFITTADLEHRSLVIYGGHLIGDKVHGFKAFYQRFHKALPHHLIVFGSGVSRRDLVNDRKVTELQLADKQQVRQFYYLQGRPKLNQMSFFHRLRASHALKHRGSHDCPQIQEAIRPLISDATHLLN